MGSFNTKCFVSQQTVSSGDRSFILPIIQSSGFNPIKLKSANGDIEVKSAWNSTCYSNAFWSPMIGQLYGKYEDYGQFILDDDEENIKAVRAYLNYVYKLSYDTEQGENQYHEKAVKFSEVYSPNETYTWDQLQEIFNDLYELVMKNRVFIRKNGYNDPRQHSFAVAHQSAVDWLINNAEQGEGWDETPLERKAWFKAWVFRIKERIEKFYSEDDQRIRAVAYQLCNLEDYGIASHILFGGQVWSEEAISIVVSEEFDYSDKYIEQLYNVFARHITLRYFLSGLESLEIKIQPLVYASQDYTNEVGSAYLDMVVAINKIVNENNRDEEYYEDQEED